MPEIREPGWESDDLPPAETTSPRPSSSSDPSSHRSSSHDGDESETRGTSGAQSQESSEAPAGLSALLAEGIQGLGSLASIFTRRRFGVSVKFRESEAKAIAKPIARLVQRRYKVKSDLNDVTDTTGIFASILSWVDRLAEESPGTETGPPDPRFTDRPARPPAPGPTLLSDEPRNAGPTPSAAPAAAQVFRTGDTDHREVGSGPLKDAIQDTYS